MFSGGILKQHSSTVSLFARLMDAVLVIFLGIFIYSAYVASWPMDLHYTVMFVRAALLVLLIFPLFGVYQSWRGSRLIHELRQCSLAWGMVMVILILLAFMTKSGAHFSRMWLGLWAVFGWAGLMIFHSILRMALRWFRKQGYNLRRVALVGAGHLGQGIVQHLREAAWTGFVPIGLYDDNSELHNLQINGVKVEGSPEKLLDLAKQGEIDEVWITMPLREEDRVIEIVSKLQFAPVNVRFVPDISGFTLLNHSMGDVAGIPMLNLHDTPMMGINRTIKALEDRVLAFLILLLISPLMALIAIFIKLDSPGPIFYRQERISWNGKRFMMLKFRSMPVGTESDSGPVWAKKDDGRASKIGRFLRRTSLDELPQFINVLAGEMSIVGPRPERPLFVEQFAQEIPSYMKKHLVKAGITGWAQVNGLRGSTDLTKRIEYDLFYITNWSLWFDLKIIFMTLFKGFVHKNAY